MLLLPDGSSTLLVEDAMQAWDAARPLPHPGFRTGQVWADLRAGGGLSYLIEVLEGHRGGSHLPWRWAGTWNSADEMHSRLADAFLLADPCCPHRAPWAPQAAP